jgi:hypothetical protein
MVPGSTWLPREMAIATWKAGSNLVTRIKSFKSVPDEVETDIMTVDTSTAQLAALLMLIAFPPVDRHHQLAFEKQFSQPDRC